MVMDLITSGIGIIIALVVIVIVVYFLFFKKKKSQTPKGPDQTPSATPPSV